MYALITNALVRICQQDRKYWNETVSWKIVTRVLIFVQCGRICISGLWPYLVGSRILSKCCVVNLSTMLLLFYGFASKFASFWVLTFHIFHYLFNWQCQWQIICIEKFAIGCKINKKKRWKKRILSLNSWLYELVSFPSTLNYYYYT